MLTCNTTLDLTLLHKQITTTVSLFYQLLLLPRLILCFVDKQWRIDNGWITYALSMVKRHSDVYFINAHLRRTI